MSARRFSTAAVLTAATVMSLSTTTAISATTARHFRNCTALNRTYPHGVGRPGAHDHTSGTPVSNFTRSSGLYQTNQSMDRDGDGIACEKG